MAKNKKQKKLKKEQTQEEEIIFEDKLEFNEALQIINYIFEKAVIVSQINQKKNIVSLQKIGIIQQFNDIKSKIAPIFMNCDIGELNNKSIWQQNQDIYEKQMNVIQKNAIKIVKIDQNKNENFQQVQKKLLKLKQKRKKQFFKKNLVLEQQFKEHQFEDAQFTQEEKKLLAKKKSEISQVEVNFWAKRELFNLSKQELQERRVLQSIIPEKIKDLYKKCPQKFTLNLQGIPIEIKKIQLNQLNFDRAEFEQKNIYSKDPDYKNNITNEDIQMIKIEEKKKLKKKPNRKKKRIEDEQEYQWEPHPCIYDIINLNEGVVFKYEDLQKINLQKKEKQYLIKQIKKTKQKQKQKFQRSNTTNKLDNSKVTLQNESINEKQRFIKKISDSLSKASKNKNISFHIKEQNISKFKDLIQPNKRELKQEIQIQKLQQAALHYQKKCRKKKKIEQQIIKIDPMKLYNRITPFKYFSDKQLQKNAPKYSTKKQIELRHFNQKIESQENIMLPKKFSIKKLPKKRNYVNSIFNRKKTHLQLNLNIFNNFLNFLQMDQISQLFLQHETDKTVDQNIQPRSFLSHYSNKWIQKFKIFWPIEEKHFFGNFLVYRIEYWRNGKKKIIQRRYSQFEALREILKKMFPCIYIQPLPPRHQEKKKLSEKQQNSFQLIRMHGLKNFLEFLISNPNVFNCEPLWVFFSRKKNFNDIKVILDSFLGPKITFLSENYKMLFPQFSQKQITIEMQNKIFEEQPRIKLNRDFMDIEKIENLNEYQQEKEFIRNARKLLFKKNTKKQEYFVNDLRTFKRKILFMKLEFSAFLELFEDYKLVIKLYKNQFEKFKTLKTELDELKEKEDEIDDYIIDGVKKEFERTQHKFNKMAIIYSITSQILLEHQLPYIYQKKKTLRRLGINLR